MIRKSMDSDIPDILKLLLQVNLVHHYGRPDLFNVGTKYTEDELKEIIKDENRPIFVNYIDGHVVGYAFCVHQQHLGDNILTDVKTLYIDDICVDENARRMHVGTDLYNYVINYAKENGYYNVTLNVWSLNPNAQKFYESLGMKPYKIGMETIIK